jgi:hypothetical protein
MPGDPPDQCTDAADQASSAEPLNICIAPDATTTVVAPPPDWVEAALIATGNTLRFALQPEAQILRSLYNQGESRIADARAQLLARLARGETTESEVARTLSTMRRDHAIHVRQLGSWLSRKAAELIDRVRGNRARPNYESLIASGRTDAEIIESASRTNAFVNRLPAGLKWTGHAFWLLSAGMSVLLVVRARPEERQQVAQREIDGALGGALGGLVVTGLVVAVGAATSGVGYVLLMLVGSVGGSVAAEQMSLTRLLDIAPHERPDCAGQMFYVEGDWSELDFFVFSIVTRSVSRADGILATATGRESGEMIGGRGHYRMLEVVPCSPAAVSLFATDSADPNVRWVPRYLLHELEEQDLAGQMDV